MVTELYDPTRFNIPPQRTAEIPSSYGRRRRPRRRLRWVRLAVIVALLAAGIGGTEAIQQVRETEPERRAERNVLPSAAEINMLRSSPLAFEILLAKREKALVEGDLETYLADLDPENEDLVESQMLIFENLQDLPVESFAQNRDSYLRPNRIPRADASDDWVSGSAYVETLVQLDEADPQPTVIRNRWDLVLRDGRLVIADIEPAKARTDHGPAPWETTKLTTARTEHMLVLTTPESAGRAREVANAAERAFDRSRSLWPRQGIDDEFVIFATEDRDLFESWYGDLDIVTADTAGWALAVPTCCSEREGLVGDVASMHIAIDLSQLNDRIELEWILAHELTHAVAEPLGAADTSTRVVWADEGYAEFVGVRLLASYGYIAGWGELASEHARSDDFTGKLPEDADFYGEDAGVHYALSVRFFEFLAGEYGRSDVRDFYFDLNAMDVPDVDALMEEHFGASEDELVDEWARWVRG